jgi:hypothetical protein
MSRMTSEKMKELFINYPVKDVRFDYKKVIIVLNGNHEIEIESEYAGYDDHQLVISHYETVRKLVEQEELDS